MNDIPRGRSVTVDMAHRFGMEPANFEKVLRATVVPANCSPEQFAAFLLVAKQYSLNPITREIYAFPARGGGIQPIVGIDGWIRIINDHEAMNGMEFRDRFGDDPKVPDAITCLIYRKDREHPTVVTEYMAECYRDTDPWKKWPARMLRHKAAIQAARYAFGFSGIIDPDEYERGVGANVSRGVSYDETMQSMQGKAPEAKAEILRTMSRRLYARMEAIASTDEGATLKGYLSELRKRLFEEGQDPEAALFGVWGEGLSDAPPKLRQAIADSLAMSGVSLDTSRAFTPPEPPRTRLEESYSITPAGKAAIAEQLNLTAEEADVIDPKPEDPEAIDPDIYLDDFDEKLSGAQKLEDLEEIWTEHHAIEDSLMPPDRDKAQFIYERHEKRLHATIAADAAPKRKK